MPQLKSLMINPIGLTMKKGRLSVLLEALLPKGIQLTANIYPVSLG